MATNTVPTFTNHTGNGTAGPFNIGFNYIDKNEIIVRVNEVLKSTPTHYTFNSNTQITFTSGNEPATGVNIELRRSTNITTAKVDFQDGSVLTETDLDANTNQLLFALQENTDAVNADNLESSNIYLRDGSRTLTGNIVFEGSTKDAHETTLAPVDPTADRTINIPNVSGTLVTTGDTGTVTSIMMANGTIVNADINASAAIQGTKISPNFGSQNISTTGQFIGDGSQLTGITFTGIDQFLRRDIDDTASGNITFNKNIFIPNHAGTSNVFNDSDVLDTGNLIFGPTPDTTSSDPMQFNNYIYHSTLNSNTEPTTVLQLGTTSSSSTRFGSFTIKGNNETLVTFTKEFGSFFEEKINIPHTNTEGIIFSNHSINNNPKIPSLQIKSNDPSSNTPDSFINCKRGNLNIACGVNGTGTVIKDVDTNGPNTIAVFKSDIGNNSGDAFHKGAVELYSEGVKRFETTSTGITVTGGAVIGGSATFAADGYLTTTSGITIENSQPGILFSDTTANPDFAIQNRDGSFAIRDITNFTNRFFVNMANGDVTATGNVNLSDNKKIQLGDSQDLQIYHDGTNSYIVDDGTGQFHIRGQAAIHLENSSGSEKYARFVQNGAVELYYDGTKKAETSADGLKVDSGLFINSGSGTLQALRFHNDITGTGVNDGASVVYSTNSHGMFFSANESTGNMIFQTGGFNMNNRTLLISSSGVVTLQRNQEPMLVATPNAGVELYYDNVKRVETKNYGAQIHGALVATSDVKVNSYVGKLIVGTSNEFTIQHDDTDTFIENTTGSLHIRPKTGEEGIKLIPDSSVQLFFDNAIHFKTTSYGAQVLGTLLVDSHLRAASDASRISAGADNDLEIFHNGSNSFIVQKQDGTGNLYIESRGTKDLILRSGNGTSGAQLSIQCAAEGATSLYFDAVKKIETTSIGIRVHGDIVPEADNTRALGASSKRFTTLHSAALNTGDINMSNLNDNANEVDGSRGSWTLQEGADDLFIINRVSGKKYKFNLTEIN